MKRNISMLLIMLLFVSSLFSCGISPEDQKRNDLIQAGVLEEYNDLLEASKNFKSIEQFDNYLLRWAAKKDIRASYDKYQNVIMSKSPSSENSSENSLNIQTSIGLDSLEDRCISVAMSLYVINTITENGFMRVIFTNNENADFAGAKGLSPRYLISDNQINLDWTYDKEKDPPKFTITNGSAATSTHQMSTPLTWVDSNYSKAYQISINNLNGGSSGIISDKHPNPIKTLGDLLASCKSSGILFELADFTGGFSADTYPANASITIVINDNDVNRFTKKVENAQNKFEDTYRKTEENYTYTITEVQKPEKVIALESTNSIVSLLYTLVNGVYSRDEESGDIVATSNLGQISTKNNEFQLLICGRSLNDTVLTQLNDTYKIIASLSEVDHAVLDETPLWKANEENPLLESLKTLGTEKYDREPKVKTSFEKTENAIFNQNENSKNILSTKVNMENYIMQTELLFDLLQEKTVPANI